MLWEAKRKNRLPHALLFVGACDAEKKYFADIFSAAMLCEKPSQLGKPCEQCHACHLVRAKSHPDFISVTPEQGQIIKIDQIRAVIQFVNETAMKGGYRIILIHPAHAMNLSSANALLKTLEEPTPNTLFILLSDQSLRLSATITSRCQKIIFNKPSASIALSWLKQKNTDNSELELLLALAEGAPFKALQLIEQNFLLLRKEFYQGLLLLSQKKADPLQLAQQWQEHDILLMLKLLLNWLRDLMRVMLASEQVELMNQDYRKVFSDVAAMLSLTTMLSYLDLTQQRYAKVVNLQNFNKQLLLEELLIRWTELCI